MKNEDQFPHFSHTALYSGLDIQIYPVLGQGHSGVVDVNATFPQKLFQLLSTESPEIIAWMPRGLSFKVFDHGRLAEEILPHYFKRNIFIRFLLHFLNYGFLR